MTAYEYGKIKQFAKCLEAAEVDAAVVAQIMEGGEGIRQSSKSDKKVGWFREAMTRMDQLLPREVSQPIREGCACCLGGKRLALSKAIAKNHATLEERIAAANETPYVFGNAVWREADGSIWVRFAQEGLESYRCACLGKVDEPLPLSYCYCCGGHVKHHLQIALGRKLAADPQETALSTAGKRPCLFRFTLAEPEAG
jgi:hypothetical protein